DCQQNGSGEWVCGADAPIVKQHAPVAVAASDNEGKADAEVKPAPQSQKTTAKPATAAGQSQPPKDVVPLAPPRKMAKVKGWDCAAGDGNETWNCSLSGTDPK